MTLYQKSVAIMIATTSVVVLASFLMANFVLVPALLEHEHHTVEERVQTLSTALDDMLTELQRITADYASWDRLYNFAAHPTAEFARTDLSDQSFERYDVQLLMVVTLDGRVALEKTTRGAHDAVMAQPDIEAIRAAAQESVVTVRQEVGVYGIVTAPSAPYIVAMHPILRSNGTGPVRGMFMTARRIDNNELAYLTRMVHAPVGVLPEADAVQRLQDGATPIAIDGRHAWFVRQPAAVDAYLEFLDLNGKPAGMLRVTSDREVVNRSMNVIWVAAMVVALIAGLLGFGKVVFLHLLILSRLRGAVEMVRRINSDDLSIRFPDNRSDELGVLARAANKMLDELEHSRNELLHLHAVAQFDACHDALTGLKNRRAMVTSLQVELTRAARQRQKLAVMLIDIDHFKRINDRFGHAAGDNVLKAVATALDSELRPYDVAGRYGGEEFLLIISGVNHVRAMEVAERLRMKVAETVVAPDGSPVTVSIGVFVTGGEEGMENVIEAADEAMYAAKAGGRNRVEIAVHRKLVTSESSDSVDRSCTAD